VRQPRLGRYAGAILILCGCGGEQFSSAGGKPDGSATATGGTGASAGGQAASNSGGATGSGAGGGGAASSGGVPAMGGSGGAVADAGLKHWCAGQKALFCADFDEFTSIDSFLNSWTTFSTSGAEFSFDSGAGVPSPPNALRIKTSSTKDVKALVTQKLPPFAKPPSKIRLEFSLRIDAAEAVGFLSGAAFAGIITGSDVTDGVVALEIGNGPALAAGYVEPKAAGSGFNAAGLPGAFPKANAWIGRYAIEIDYTDVTDASRGGCAQVLAGGAPQLNQCLKLPASLAAPPYVSVALGVFGGGLAQTGNIELRFDNVVLTAE
jgi:hypothetical protein